MACREEAIIMQVINVTKEGKNSPIMIFRNEKDGRVFFSTTVSHKDMDGNYQNAFMSVRFKKNVEVANKQLIILKDAWLDFFQTKDGHDVIMLFVNDFDKVESR